LEDNARKKEKKKSEMLQLFKTNHFFY